MENIQRERKRISVNAEIVCRFFHVHEGFAYCQASHTASHLKYPRYYGDIISSEIWKCEQLWSSCPNYKREAYVPDWKPKTQPYEIETIVLTPQGQKVQPNNENQT